jgi:flagellar biosynthesis GTPase FlhF
MGYDVGEVDPALAAAAGYTDQIERKAGDYGIFSGRGTDGQGNFGVIGDVAGAVGDLAGFTKYNTPDVIEQRKAAEAQRIASERAAREAAITQAENARKAAAAKAAEEQRKKEAQAAAVKAENDRVAREQAAAAAAAARSSKKRTSSALKKEMSKQQKNVSAVKSGTYKRSMGGF